MSASPDAADEKENPQPPRQRLLERYSLHGVQRALLRRRREGGRKKNATAAPKAEVKSEKMGGFVADVFLEILLFCCVIMRVFDDATMTSTKNPEVGGLNNTKPILFETLGGGLGSPKELQMRPIKRLQRSQIGDLLEIID